MVSEPQEPFCDLRFSKLGFKIFEHSFWCQNVTFGMIFLSEKTKKQENILQNVLKKSRTVELFVLPTRTHTSLFSTKKGPLTIRLKNRKNDLQTHFRTAFFAPEQQHTSYVQSSLFLFSNFFRRENSRMSSM